jgi:hypothetical protein
VQILADGSVAMDVHPRARTHPQTASTPVLAPTTAGRGVDTRPGPKPWAVVQHPPLRNAPTSATTGGRPHVSASSRSPCTSFGPKTTATLRVPGVGTFAAPAQLPVRTARTVRKVVRTLAATGQITSPRPPNGSSSGQTALLLSTKGAPIPEAAVRNGTSVIRTCTSWAMDRMLKVPTSTLGLRTEQHSERLVSLDRAGQKLRALYAGMYVPRTLRRRQQTYARLLAWCRERDVAVSPNTASLFAVAIVQEPQGTLGIVRELLGILQHMFDATSMSPLLLLKRALVMQGAEVPISQSLPVPRQELHAWIVEEMQALRQVPHPKFGRAPLAMADVAMACLLCWKTVSRWDDVASLGHDNLRLVTQKEILIDWWTTPKGRRSDPQRPSRYALVTGRNTTALCNWLSAKGAFTQLSDLVTTEINTLWSRHPVMNRFQVSGIKPGARTFLQAKSARGEMPDVSQIEICRLAKHSDPADPFKNVGMSRYSRDHMANAVSLGTGKVTRYL